MQDPQLHFACLPDGVRAKLEGAQVHQPKARGPQVAHLHLPASHQAELQFQPRHQQSDDHNSAGPAHHRSRLPLAGSQGSSSQIFRTQRAAAVPVVGVGPKPVRHHLQQQDHHFHISVVADYLQAHGGPGLTPAQKTHRGCIA